MVLKANITATAQSYFFQHPARKLARPGGVVMTTQSLLFERSPVEKLPAWFIALAATSCFALLPQHCGVGAVVGSFYLASPLCRIPSRLRGATSARRQIAV
jgi:hypothetical protein